MAALAHHPSRRRRRIAVASLVAVVAAVGACTGDDDGDAAAETTEAGPATSATTEAAAPTTDAPEAPAAGAPDGCPATDEIEAIVGQPVQVSASGGGRGGTDGISYSATGCSYRLAEGGSVGIDRVSWDGDGFAFDGLSDDARTTTEQDGFEPVDDLGDQAWRDGTTIAVLDGDVVIFAEVEPAPGDGPEVAGALGEILAGAVVGLDLDVGSRDLCRAVEDDVADALGPVASARASTGGIVVDDVQLDLTGCRLDLVDGAEALVRVADADDWDPWVAAMQAQSSDTGYAPFTIGQVSAFDTGAALVVDDGDEPLRITTEDLDLDADAAADLRLEVAELALGS